MTDEHKKILLLADDDPLILRMYQNRFDNEGYKVNTATNGEEALNSIRKEKPDLVLMDVMMPIMNGVEALKAIKNDARTKSIPVIMLTNLGDKQEDIKAAKELGVLDYLVKSELPLKDLSERIKKILGL